MPSHDGKQIGQSFGSAEEWAESHRRLIPGPGWLDEKAPCACSSSRATWPSQAYQNHRITLELIRRESAAVVYTFALKAKGTKDQ